LEKRAAENKLCEEIANSHWHGALDFQPALRSKGQVLQLLQESVGSRKRSCTCYANRTTTLDGSPSLEKKKAEIGQLVMQGFISRCDIFSAFRDFL